MFTYKDVKTAEMFHEMEKSWAWMRNTDIGRSVLRPYGTLRCYELIG